MTKEEEVKEEKDDTSSDKPFSSLFSSLSSSPTHLVARTNIVTKVDAEMVKEEKT